MICSRRDLAVFLGGLEFLDSSERDRRLGPSAMRWAVIKTWGSFGSHRRKRQPLFLWMARIIPHDCSRTIQIVEFTDVGLDGSRTVNNAFFLES